MPVPHLPPEVWCRISANLSPASLSTLSQVSRTLHEICLDQKHFRRLLRFSQTDTNPVLLFRRLQAWSSPQLQIGHTDKSTFAIFHLCIVLDTLLFIDTDNFRLISFPSHKTIGLRSLIGDVLFNHWELARFNACFAVLPDANIAFITWQSPTTLAILNVSKWQVVKHRIPERKLTTKKVDYDSYITLAGNRGEYIMYYTDDNTLVLVDWRTGQLVKDITHIPEKVLYVYGECPAINRNTVVGLAERLKVGGPRSLKQVHVTGFDGVEIKFAIAYYQRRSAVLRSADTKTHVLVAYGPSKDSHGHYEFVAYRSHGELTQSWSGNLKKTSALGLQNNGRIVASRHKHWFSSSGEYDTTERRMVYMELRDDGTTEELFIPELETRGQAVWHRRTFDGGFAVVGSPSGLIQLVKLVKDEKVEKQCVIKSWTVEGLQDLCVLADHVIVAERADGSLTWFHFDRFCRGFEGVHACPLTALLTTFRFNSPVSVGEGEVPVSKRRRIS